MYIKFYVGDYVVVNNPRMKTHCCVGIVIDVKDNPKNTGRQYKISIDGRSDQWFAERNLNKIYLPVKPETKPVEKKSVMVTLLSQEEYDDFISGYVVDSITLTASVDENNMLVFEEEDMLCIRGRVYDDCEVGFYIILDGKIFKAGYAFTLTPFEFPVVSDKD